MNINLFCFLDWDTIRSIGNCCYQGCCPAALFGATIKDGYWHDIRCNWLLIPQQDSSERCFFFILAFLLAVIPYRPSSHSDSMGHESTIQRRLDVDDITSTVTLPLPLPYRRRQQITMMLCHSITFLVLTFLSLVLGQQQYQGYDQDYANDNLYHDYAMRQQEKDVGKA